MYKGFVLLIFGLLLLTLIGCGPSEREIRITQTLTTISEVSDVFHNLKKDLTNAMDRRKKETPAELNDQDWKPLIIKAEELKKIAEKAQALKGYTDALAAKTTAEQKKQFADNYGNQFRDKIAELDSEMRGLETTLNEADKMTATKDKEFVKSFRKQLQDGKDVFELLTKQR